MPVQNIPLPTVQANADSRPYWDAAAQERLLLRACKACGTRHFMPRHLCPVCWSDQLEWTQSTGLGVVHSFTTVHRAPSPAFTQRTPYVLALIDLDEGPRMMANILGDAGALAIGDRVRVVFEDRGEGQKVPQFVRDGAAA